MRRSGEDGRTEQTAADFDTSDTLRGLKPCSFSELLPSNMPGVPRTTWREPGYLRGLDPLPTALGTLQPATRLGGAVAYGDVCDSSNFSIMVDVLRGDLLPTTANSELSKNESSVPRACGRVPNSLLFINMRKDGLKPEFRRVNPACGVAPLPFKGPG